MQWLKDKTNKLNQRREDNAMAKRQDKQTINQRREDRFTVCLSCLFLLAIALSSLL
jgi:hypothetical protein